MRAIPPLTSGEGLGGGAFLSLNLSSGGFAINSFLTGSGYPQGGRMTVVSYWVLWFFAKLNP